MIFGNATGATNRTLQDISGRRIFSFFYLNVQAQAWGSSFLCQALKVWIGLRTVLDLSLAQSELCWTSKIWDGLGLGMKI